MIGNIFNAATIASEGIQADHGRFTCAIFDGGKLIAHALPRDSAQERVFISLRVD